MKKLSCIWYGRDLVAYVDGELPPAKAARLERHIAACTACKEAAADIGLLNAVAAPAAIEPGPDFDRLFWARIAHESDQEHPAGFFHGLSQAKSFFTSPAGLTLSAGLAMCVFVISLFLMRGGPAAPRHREIMAAADLDLYANFEIIQNSEALENFELIEMLDELAQDEQG